MLLSRFMSRLGDKIKTILKLMTKDENFVCDDVCEKAFLVVKDADESQGSHCKN